jgi:hypothetical protein
VRHASCFALVVLSVAICAAVLPAGAAETTATGRYVLQTRGIWTEFDDPASPNGWYSGELLHNGNFGPARPTVETQLRAMSAMGVNEIAYELRSGDPIWIPGDRKPPECHVSPDTGLQYPQPTQEELTNLGRLFDLASAHGVKIALILNNTHMDDRTNSQRWLGTILGVVKGKPALDYVAFGGDKFLIDQNGDGVPESCGGLSEAPLWLGPSSVQGGYVQWAIGYGMSLGFSAAQLTAESIVGFYPVENRADAGPDAQDNHLWSPIAVLRTIFDRLGVAESDRTYAVSFYEHRKCAGSFIHCTDEDPQVWADETAQYVRSVAGPVARVTAVEFGDLTPVSPSWPTEKAVEGLGVVMQRYGIDGGTFWHWEDVTGDAPANFGDPVKQRGPGLVYYPVQRELADLYGFHVGAVPNGSFEQGLTGWRVTGQGGAQPIPLDVTGTPWRGQSFLRITASGTTSITGTPIRISPSTRYTTTANLRFSWTGDRHPGAPLAKRPQVDVMFRYLTCAGRPSRVHAQIIFRYFQTQATTGFQTFPFTYTTPKDGCYVQVGFAAVRNRLTTPVVLDVDNVR